MGGGTLRSGTYTGSLPRIGTRRDAFILCDFSGPLTVGVYKGSKRSTGRCGMGETSCWSKTVCTCAACSAGAPLVFEARPGLNGASNTCPVPILSCEDLHASQRLCNDGTMP